MAYESPTEREQRLWDAKAKLDAALQPFNQAAPRSFTDENAELYRRRTLPLVQLRAPGFENIKVDEARGSAFDLIEKQIYEAAHKEALRPTQIADGELKQVTSYDVTGRPSFSFFGSPSAWMKQFTGERRRLAGIRTATAHGFNPTNLG